jgi:hypothetical protein
MSFVGIGSQCCTSTWVQQVKNPDLRQLCLATMSMLGYSPSHGLANDSQLMPSPEQSFTWHRVPHHVSRIQDHRRAQCFFFTVVKRHGIMRSKLMPLELRAWQLQECVSNDDSYMSTTYLVVKSSVAVPHVLSQRRVEKEVPCFAFESYVVPLSSIRGECAYLRAPTGCVSSAHCNVRNIHQGDLMGKWLLSMIDGVLLASLLS